MMVTVSNYVEDQKPGKAFDQNEETSWVSGEFPVGFIQIDFLKNTLLDRIELVVDQFPAGFTRHQILGAQDGHILDLAILHEFADITESFQTLVYPFEASNRNFRFISVATFESPSWVAWREIRLFKSDISAVKDIHSDSIATVKVFPNIVISELTVELQLYQALEDVEIVVLAMDGKTNFQTGVGYLSAGKHQVIIEPRTLAQLAPGHYMIMVKAGSLFDITKFIKL